MTLQIEEGKYYRTRDGRKVGPVYNSDGEWSSEDNIACMIPMWNLKTGAANFISFGPESDHPEFDLVAEWKDAEEMAHEDTPKMWKDMTDEEKGALLLAHHKGETIEFFSHPNWHDDNDFNPKDDPFLYYRVKPAPKEPKRETVTIGWDGIVPCKDLYEGVDTHKITFDLIDGVPDCDSIKMEEL